MLAAEPRSLLRKLNATCTRALEVAAAACVSARHYEVTAEHLFVALLDDRESDVAVVFEHYHADVEGARWQLKKALSSLRDGNPGKPVFSPLLLAWVQDAWVYASAELGEATLRSGALLVRAALVAGRYFPSDVPALEALPSDELRRRLAEIARPSAEAAAGAAAPGATPEGRARGASPAAGGPEGGALARFTTDLTEKARQGKLDPVLGREAEVRQIVDVLVRRRKNNPLVVGDAGVGKTAIVEGLALRIVEGSVPEALKPVALLSLDLAALQ
ncbi:MAG: type VI secretion system ATPase TssH, partial [Polyangiaceae bacterium]|nr:type VI secretion system ATPase TssH [Polyangiaceae bacterium]